MAFVFNVENAPQAASNENRKEIDWDARSKYLVEKAGTQDGPEALIGIVSGVIDLGLQKQEDAKMEFKGTEEDEAEELKKNPAQYFATLENDKGIPTRYKRWVVKPCQQVALTVDFPDIMVNNDQFFAESDAGIEHPLRQLLNGEFFIKGIGKTVGKPYNLKETRSDDGSWSIKNNTILYKLAQATGGVLDDKGLLKPAYIGNLLGKAALFDVQLFIQESQGKHYLNEKIKLNGQVPKAMQKLIPTLDDKYIYGVNFKGPQDKEVLKNLRQSIITTMSLATNFEGSDVQKALIELGRVKASDSSQEQQPEQAIPRTTAPQETRKVEPIPTPQTPNFDSFDDDIPFSPIGLQEGRMFLHMI